MLIKTRGIVFRAVKYGETSLICEILTEDFGLQSYIAQGVRSSKSKSRTNLLRVGSLVEVIAYHREDRGLNRLKEVKAAYVFRHLPFELVKGTVALFMAELVQKAIRACEPDQDLFQFLFDSFVFLDQSPNSVANIHLVFLLKLSHYIGFGPALSSDPERPIFDLMEGVYVGEGQSGTYTLNRKQSDQLAILLNASFEDCHNLRFSRQERHDLLIQLLDYYRLHLEHFKGLNSHVILHEVLG